MLSGLDRNIGRVIANLEKQGLANNTVIIFMADNGYYMGERGFAGKWSHYDQSLRVPLVIHDPRVQADCGEVFAGIALNLDIAPTMLQLANVSLPDRYQGITLSRLGDSRDGFFCEHRMDNNRIPKWEGYHGKRFVYANYYEQLSGKEFLHDLESDPDQIKNLVHEPQYADVLKRLRQRTTEQSRQYVIAR